MTEPKRKYRKWTKKTDISPVRRCRFTENELHLILESVSFYADYLAQTKWPEVKKQCNQLVNENIEYCRAVLHQQWYGIKPEDPQYEAYEKAESQREEVRSKVDKLNHVERQLRLGFKEIDPKTPSWVFTTKRVMHL